MISALGNYQQDGASSLPSMEMEVQNAMGFMFCPLVCVHLFITAHGAAEGCLLEIMVQHVEGDKLHPWFGNQLLWLLFVTMLQSLYNKRFAVTF